MVTYLYIKATNINYAFFVMMWALRGNIQTLPFFKSSVCKVALTQMLLLNSFLILFFLVTCLDKHYRHQICLNNQKVVFVLLKVTKTA